jgi:hypothetical protein
MLLITFSYWMPRVAMNTTGMPSLISAIGPVLHLRRGHALGVDVADFLELQRAFQRHRVVIPAAEEQPVLPLTERPGDVAADSFCLSTCSICSGIAHRPSISSWHCAGS